MEKTRLYCSSDNFVTKTFRLSTKGKLSIFLNFLFSFVSFIGVFSILKCKTLVLKTTACHLLIIRCQFRFFPYPLKSTNHLLSRQILIGQSCLKPIQTIVEKTLQGEERRNSCLLTATRKERTDVGAYGDVITKFPRIDRFPPISIPMEAPLYFSRLVCIK